MASASIPIELRAKRALDELYDRIGPLLTADPTPEIHRELHRLQPKLCRLHALAHGGAGHA